MARVANQNDDMDLVHESQAINAQSLVSVNTNDTNK